MPGGPEPFSYLSDPAFHLFDIDADARQLIFLQTTEQTLRQSAFLDGRTAISVDGRLHRVPLRKALNQTADINLDPHPRFLLHTSFCGSTLLANAIQAASNVLVLREPNILVQLSNLKAAQHKLYLDKAIWPALIQLTLNQLGKTWSPGAVLVKPSNWANTLLSDVKATDGPLSAMYMTMSEDAYLLANLRGGKERLAYSLQLMNHLLNSGLMDRSAVLEVERGQHSPIGRLLRLLSLTHGAQQHILSDQLPDAVALTLPDLQNDLRGNLLIAGDALGLTINPVWADRKLGDVSTQHAKNGSEVFSSDVEAAENRRLRNSFAADFEDLANWRDTPARDTA